MNGTTVSLAELETQLKAAQSRDEPGGAHGRSGRHGGRAARRHVVDSGPGGDAMIVELAQIILAGLRPEAAKRAQARAPHGTVRGWTTLS
jgi:hypothetical protein